jgi:hypothetical protein
VCYCAYGVFDLPAGHCLRKEGDAEAEEAEGAEGAAEGAEGEEAEEKKGV